MIRKAGKQSPQSPAPLRIYALVLLIVSLPLLGGGTYLTSLGGSPYYLLAGLAVAASAILLWRARVEGALLYALLLLLTLPWAVWEAGLDGWALLPRLVAPVVLGLPLLLPALHRRLNASSSFSRRMASAPALIGALVLAIGASAALRAVRPADPVDPIYQTGKFAGAVAAPLTGARAAQDTDGDWLHYGRDASGTRSAR